MCFRIGWSHCSCLLVSRFCSWVPQGAAKPLCDPSYCPSLPNHEINSQPPRPIRTTPSSNNPASLTTRFGATIDVEQNHVRFLGDLVLNLWDCGGQDSFMDSYLSTQRSTIFQHVAVLIYVFDIETREAVKDLEYYRDCIEGLKKYSPEAKVFLLVHKMDLVRENTGDALIKKRTQLEQESTGLAITVFGTSIYNESLYRVRHFVILSELVILSLCVTGLVSYRSHVNPKREHPVEAPLNACTSVRRY